MLGEGKHGVLGERMGAAPETGSGGGGEAGSSVVEGKHLPEMEDIFLPKIHGNFKELRIIQCS